MWQPIVWLNGHMCKNITSAVTPRFLAEEQRYFLSFRSREKLMASELLSIWLMSWELFTALWNVISTDYACIHPYRLYHSLQIWLKLILAACITVTLCTFAGLLHLSVLFQCLTWPADRCPENVFLCFCWCYSNFSAASVLWSREFCKIVLVSQNCRLFKDISTQVKAYV